MSNFELIEDYLTHRLGEQEKAAFERQMGSDPALKTDVDFQKQIIEGVKNARGLELKAMLNQVPVSGGSVSTLTAGKIVATAITLGIISATVYFYLKPGEQKNSSSVNSEPPSVNREIEKEKVIPSEPAPRTPIPVAVTSEPKNEKSKTISKKKTEVPTSNPAQPKIEVVDPSGELVDNADRKTGAKEGQKSSLTASHIVVETNSSNKNYNFHYQFFNSKLVLYGSFDKSLYEILEINGEHKTVFLFYKDNYYLLNEKQNNITRLEPIKDGALLKKLKEYRGL